MTTIASAVGWKGEGDIMSANWTRGALVSPAWHGEGRIAPMPDAATMLRLGVETGAYPVSIGTEAIYTADGLSVPGMASVATYQGGSRVAHAVVSGAYRPCSPEQWADLVRAAVKAGASPNGAFSLKHGSVMVGCFALPSSTGWSQYLTLTNGLDAEHGLRAMSSSVRVVCTNTMGRSWSQAGAANRLRIRHTGDMASKVVDLRETIEAHVASGAKLRATYEQARDCRISREQAEQLIVKLVPVPEKIVNDETGEVTNQAAISRALNRRHDVAGAMTLSENQAGPTLATIWNAATWVNDHTAARKGADLLESMLLGSRGLAVDRIVQTMVSVLRADGSVEDVPMDSPLATAAHATLGASILDDML